MSAVVQPRQITNSNSDARRFEWLAECEHDDPEIALEPPTPEQRFTVLLRILEHEIGAMRFLAAADACRQLAALQRQIESAPR